MTKALIQLFNGKNIISIKKNYKYVFSVALKFINIIDNLFYTHNLEFY